MSSNINNLLTYEESNKIAILTLNRPNQQNSLSSDLMRELISKLDEIKNNKNIKVVTLFANGKNTNLIKRVSNIMDTPKFPNIFWKKIKMYKKGLVKK